MKYIKRTFILFAIMMAFSAVNAQRILLIDKPGKFKNFKYFIGDKIELKLAPNGNKTEGTIHVITDTSLIINFDNEIMLEDIEMVLKPRWGLKLLSKITRIAGAGYFLLDVVNNAITGNPTIVYKNTVMISAGLVAFSYALVPLHNRRMTPGDKWRMQVLNMDLDEPAPNPFQQ